MNAAITPLVPALSEQADGEVLPLAEKTTPDSTIGVMEVADLGVAISRSEIEQHMSKPEPKSKAKHAVEDLSPKPGVTDAEKISSGEGTSTSSKVEQKSKKSKKSRDEFDSLFDSLETKKPSKKKNRKKADEFDDLFSSLL